MRFDAGYHGEALMAALEERGTHYVARVRNNTVLKRLALPAIDAVVWDALNNGGGGEPPYVDPPVVLPGEVVVPPPLNPAMLLASVHDAARGDRRRGAPGSVPPARQGRGPPRRADERRLAGPAVGPPSQSHYRGRGIAKPGKGVDAFACNQVRLLLAGFGYQIMHVQRAMLERKTGTGWSLRRLAERVLRTPARFTVSGRRVTLAIGGASAHWLMLARGLAPLQGHPG